MAGSSPAMTNVGSVRAFWQNEPEVFGRTVFWQNEPEGFAVGDDWLFAVFNNV
jgi:hypothetical protein